MILDLFYQETENNQVCFTNPKIKIEENKQSPLFSYGGLAIVRKIVEKLSIAETIDSKLSLLKKHRPYHESDHILNFVYNFLSGGDAIIDIDKLRKNKGLLRLLGTESYPAPTTAGDFLARFKSNDIESFRKILNVTQKKAFSLLDNKRKKTATIDSDSSIHEVYGVKKEGADYSYTKKWSYSALYFTLMETGDLLDIDLRGGNVYSSHGTSDRLSIIIKNLKPHFAELRYRGDSAFYDKDIVSLCDKNEVEFFITADQTKKIMREVLDISEKEWKSLYKNKLRKCKTKKKRKKRKNHKKIIGKQRNSRIIEKGKSEVASFTYQPVKWEKPYRFVVKRTEIIDESGQLPLDETLCKYRYHIIVTNSDYSESRVMRIAQGRGNQENLIKDFKDGLSLSHIPTGFFDANKIYFLIAMLAWNIKTWMLNLLDLDDGAVLRCKRFFYLWIYHACIISRTARNWIVIRLTKGEYYYRFSKAMKKACSL